MTPAHRVRSSDVLYAGGLALAVAGVSLSFMPDLLTPWMIPLVACGWLTSIDLVRVARGKLDLLDPVGMIGLVGFHFFYLAPLLHAYTGYWMWLEPVDEPTSWIPWVGAMALINAIGLVAYQVGYRLRWQRRPPRTLAPWVLDRRMMVAIASVVLPATAFLQVWVYRSFGGIWGYIQAFETGREQFSGMGVVFMFSELFPLVLFILILVIGRHWRIAQSWWFVPVLLVSLILVRTYFGGLRGSRANFIWYLLWMGMATHVFIRRIRWVHLVPMLVVVIGFSTVYWYYKVLGQQMFDERSRSVLEEQGDHRGGVLTSVLLGDLGRADVQAFLLYQSIGERYDLALGQTYLYALLVPVPTSLWPDRPRNKVEVGTDALYGRGNLVPGGTQSSRVYGAAGEAMLNFGPAAVPIAYLLLGIVVGGVRRYRWRIPPHDARYLIYPLFLIACLQLLMLDLDNVLYYLVTVVLLPSLIIRAGSRALGWKRGAWAVPNRAAPSWSR